MRPPAPPPGRLLVALATLSGALDRVRRDPATVGAALVSEQGPAPVVALLRPVVRLLARAGRPGARVLSAHGAGDEARVAALVADTRGARPVVRREVARALLAVGRHDDARALLGGDGSEAARTLIARALWSAGHLDEAVATTPSRRAARRWQAEVDVLSRRPRRAAHRAPAPPAGRPVRVLHLVTNSLPHTRSGYTGRSHRILLAQREAGLQVSAVTPYGYPGTVLRLPEGPTETVDGIVYRRLLPRRWESSPTRRLQRELALLDEVVAQARPDVLHAHSHFVNALTALELGARHGLPVVYEVRGLLEETWAQRNGPDATSSRRYRLFQEQEAYAVAAADAALTLGGAMRDVLTERARPRRPLRLVPNAVPSSSLLGRGDGAGARERLGIPAGSLVVGSVSSVVDYEGFDVLVRAVARLAGAGVDVTMLLVGDGDAAPAVRALSATVPSPGRVLMPGRVPQHEVAGYLAALDVFAVPRLDLAVCRLVTPLKPAEAMAAGLPLVVSDLPALREFVDDGVEGLVVPPGDPEALAGALARLADADLRRVMGERGRERVAATRTWEAVVTTYQEVYDEVLGRGPAVTP